MLYAQPTGDVNLVDAMYLRIERVHNVASLDGVNLQRHLHEVGEGTAQS